MPPILQGFDTVKIGDRTRELIQVSDQFSPIFLLNITGTAVADLLSDVAQLDDINLAMRLVTKDRKDASATRKVREKDVLDLEQGLKVYNTLDNTARRVERVETLHADLTTKESQVRQVDSFLVRASGVTQSIKGLKDALQGDLPEAQGLSGKASRLKEVSGFFKAIQERALVIRDLKGVDDIEVPALGSLRERIQRLKELGSQLAKLRALKEALEKFQGFDAVALPAKLGASEVLSRLEALDRYLDRLATMQASILKLEQDLDVATEEEATVLAEFDALGVCPTCTQKVGPGHKENHA
jgi:hypothetical protein